MKIALKSIANEQSKYGKKIYYGKSDIGHDLLVIQKGVRYAIDNNDPRLEDLLVKAAALIATEIDQIRKRKLISID